ncbi:MAG: DUF429 domain-containing protein [Thermoleophilia bacterium]|nr:DUF429 domain-containing protein [Thermoleophilia bacterium]
MAGIDVAWARPCTCVLVKGGVVREWLDTSEPERIAAWVDARRPEVVAVDAPCGVSKGLLAEGEFGEKPYQGRVCDRELRRRGIPLYEVPRERAEADSWMEMGFRIYDLVGELGYRLPREMGAGRSVIEVYPHASFVTLLGGTPAKKSTTTGQSQRLGVLREEGLVWDGRFDHDSLDALAAALTALRFLEGRAYSVGEAEEALVWLPVESLEDSYRPLLGAR